ncbi:MAG: FAD-dependent oxidoreductase, partial [Bacteriovoracaceae bacterium]
MNESKGFAVQSTRVQIDKGLYSKFAEQELTKIPNLQIIYQKVLRISKENDFIIETDSSTWNSKKLIVTVGTFLNGKLHVGPEQKEGGRHDCESSNELLSLFSQVKNAPKRFKTGTPPRLLKKSIDLTKLEEQPSDNLVRNFHNLNAAFERHLPQSSCYLARTNSSTMDVIGKNLEKSPMYNGQITAVGARYCPSIEDKASRYPDKSNHHVFIEPEGLEEESMYPSGISSSLPKDVQEKMVNSISGLERAQISVYGYAVEYDVVDTTELNYSLEYDDIPGLYFAGQVNGTSGYEEAAGQGFAAGANAALILTGKTPLRFSRNNSYIGVMIEDLISNLRDEPYRLFTARSENRLFIREDNAILRLFNDRRKLGLKTAVDFFN